MINLLIDSGLPVATILETEISVQESAFNLDILKEYLPPHPSTVTPEQAMRKRIKDIEFAMWLSSNQSRTVSVGEVKEAESFSLGVDKNDRNSIRQACFNSDKTLNSARPVDAAKWLFNIEMLSREDLKRADVSQHSFPVMLPIMNATVASGWELRQTTVDSIITSFIAALKGYMLESEPNPQTGKTVKRAIWGNDLADWDAFSDIIAGLATQTQNGQSIFTEGLDAAMASLEPGNPYVGNVARNASTIGKTIAEFFNQRFNPQFPVEFPTKKEKAPKAGKKNKQRPVKVSRVRA